MDLAEKNSLLDDLSVCYNSVNYLKTLAEEKNADPALVDRLDEQKRDLKTMTDGLLQNLYSNWIGEAKELRDSIAKSNGTLNQCVENIQKDEQIAQNLANAVGYIDDVVKVVAGIAAK